MASQFYATKPLPVLADEKPFFKKEGGGWQVEHLPASLIIFKMTDEVDCLKKITVIFMLTMHNIMNKCGLFYYAVVMEKNVFPVLFSIILWFCSLSLSWQTLTSVKVQVGRGSITITVENMPKV